MELGRVSVVIAPSGSAEVNATIITDGPPQRHEMDGNFSTDGRLEVMSTRRKNWKANAEYQFITEATWLDGKGSSGKGSSGDMIQEQRIFTKSD